MSSGGISISIAVGGLSFYFIGKRFCFYFCVVKSMRVKANLSKNFYHFGDQLLDDQRIFVSVDLKIELHFYSLLWLPFSFLYLYIYVNSERNIYIKGLF